MLVKKNVYQTQKHNILHKRIVETSIKCNQRKAEAEEFKVEIKKKIIVAEDVNILTILTVRVNVDIFIYLFFERSLRWYSIHRKVSNWNTRTVLYEHSKRFYYQREWFSNDKESLEI